MTKRERAESVTDALVRTNAAVEQQREHVASLRQTSDASAAKYGEHEAALRRAMGSVGTSSRTLERLREDAARAAEQRDRDSDALRHGEEELKRCVDARERVRIASAQERYAVAHAELIEFCGTFAARVDALLAEYLPLHRQYTALRRAEQDRYRELAKLRAVKPRALPPVVVEIGERWPGFLNKSMVLGQLAELGGLPMSPRPARPPSRSAAEILRRIGQASSSSELRRRLSP